MSTQVTDIFSFPESPSATSSSSSSESVFDGQSAVRPPAFDPNLSGPLMRKPNDAGNSFNTPSLQCVGLFVADL